MAEESKSAKTAEPHYNVGKLLVQKISGHPHYRDFVCGWSAACIETCVMYPLYKLIFRQQLHGLLVNEAISQLRLEGAAMLYRGLLPPLIMKTSSRAVMFGTYDEYRKLLGCRGHSFTMKHALAAFLAGSTEAMLCPLERVQVLLQSTKYQDQMRNTANAMKEVRPYGLREFYRGWTPIVLRNGLSNILFFGLRGPLRDYLDRFGKTAAPSSVENENKPSPSASLDAVRSRVETPSSQSSSVAASEPPAAASKPTDIQGKGLASPAMRRFMADFVSGAVLGATISTIFYPLNVVKTRMMSTLGTEFVSMRQTFLIIWRERNRSVRELFRGVHLNYSRSLLAWGITNSTFEFLRRLLQPDQDDDR